MTKIKEKILNANFKKIPRCFIVIVFIYLLAGGILGVMAVKTQLSEIISLKEKGAVYLEENKNKDEVYEEYSKKKDKEKHHSQKEEWKNILKTQITPLSFNSKIILVIILGIGHILMLVYWILISAWLYQAADKAKMRKNLWAAVGLIGNILAVILFISVRDYIRIKCSHCDEWQKKNQFCIKCGSSFNKECPSCHSIVAQSEKYCGFCGTSLIENDNLNN